MIKKIGGKPETRKFLENLGFVAGGMVTVVSEISGNVIVNVKESRIAVSKEMAILKLIEDINRKYGNTVIMVTHNDAIKNMADRVVKLRDGMIRKNYVNETKIAAAELEW